MFILVAFGLGRIAASHAEVRNIGPRQISVSDDAQPPVATRPSDESPSYGYDVRRGAAAYAPIIGGVASFVVTAVVLVFEIVSSHHGSATAMGRAASLLALGLISCLLGAFAFAAIGAERNVTPELPAASMYAGAATAIGVVAIIAAFDVLASVYLRDTETLFAVMTGGTAIAAAVLVALVLGDVWINAPDGHWLADQSKGYFWGSLASALVTTVLLVGTILHFDGAGVRLGETGMHWFIGSGMVLAVLGGLGSMFRTGRPPDRTRPLGRSEVCLVLSLLVAYLFVLLLFIP